MLDTNAVDIDQAPFADFNYNEMEGEDEVEEVDEGAYEQAQAKKSVRSKNYTILEDQILESIKIASFFTGPFCGI